MQARDGSHGRGSYGRLAAELAVNYVIMYLVMYTMIASLSHFYLNLNNAYMTLMMLAPMAAIMTYTMRSMFPSRWANAAVIVGAVVVFAASFAAMRTQAAVGDA